MFPSSPKVEKSIKWMKGIVICQFIFWNEIFRGMWWAGWLPVCGKSFLLLLYANMLCPCSSWISTQWTTLQALVFSKGNPKAVLKSASKKEEWFWLQLHLWQLGHVFSWTIGWPKPWGGRAAPSCSLLTSLYFHTSDFCLSCLNCQFFREVLYSTYCNRTPISSEASEHCSNINNKKAFIKAYKGNSLCYDLRHVKWGLENIPPKDWRIN